MIRWLVLLAALCVVPAYAADTAASRTLLIWGGAGPGSEGLTKAENFQVYNDKGERRFWNITRPILAAYYAEKPNGAAVLMLPGGGYGVVNSDSIVPVARWFASIGVDAFILSYRLPDDGHKAGDSVPLQDAQRALRLIRAGAFARDRAIDPARIGVMGFSAGGNLAAVLSLYHNAKVYEPRDHADQVSARPDFMILAYPVLPKPDEVPDNPRQPNISRLYHRYPVTDGDGLPPTFLMHGENDNDVPASQSHRFARVLQTHDVPVELHVFAGTGHSFKLDAPGEAHAWPGLLADWLKKRAIVP